MIPFAVETVKVLLATVKKEECVLAAIKELPKHVRATIQQLKALVMRQS